VRSGEEDGTIRSDAERIGSGCIIHRRNERFMSTSLPRIDQLVLISAVLAGGSIGCSRPADRAPSTEAASSSALPSTDTAAVSADSAGPAAAETSTSAATTPTQAPSAQDTAKKTGAAAKPKPLPRPSIDPGRKPAAAEQDTSAKSTPNTAAPQPSGAGPDQGLKYDAASNTVTFDLVGGPSGFQFNGYANGGATLTLPSKANVVMNFVNKDGTPHSAEVISGEGPLPNAATDVAIPKAYTNQRLQGLPQEGTDVMRFQVPESGTYRIICGVPGHALSGMWIWMKVDPAAKAPSFGPTKG